MLLPRVATARPLTGQGDSDLVEIGVGCQEGLGEVDEIYAWAMVERLIAVGASLPQMPFRRLGGPGTVSWSQGPSASIVFVPHAGSCQECLRYLADLGSAVEELREWATRVLVLAGSGPVEGPPGVLMLADPDGAGRGRLGIPGDQAGVLQADRWGSVYQVETAGAGAHTVFPVPRDLVAMAKYIDIQCPECGIPSTEWMAVSPFPLG